MNEVSCPACATTNSRVAPFCTNCGSALPVPDSGRTQSAPDTDLTSRQELQDEINELRTILRDASGRLSYLQRLVNRLEPETETETPGEMSALAASSQVKPEQTRADV